MPIPLSINLCIARHLLIARLRKRQRIPLVLMLELTHACNLNCQGCGRIREYHESTSTDLSREQAHTAMIESNTPVVSISGGEPLLHRDAPLVAADALKLGKVVYLCTNALLLSKRLHEFRPHSRFHFNVHLDGLSDVHDALTGKDGTADSAIVSIRKAKAAGFRITTNTTVYRATQINDLLKLFKELEHLHVDGVMLSPAFNYEVGIEAETLSRAEANRFFQLLRQSWDCRILYHTPLYLNFLCGERELNCVPWGTVTYGPQEWKRPCYLLTDGHVCSFDDLINRTEWAHHGYGVDPRCSDCMIHSGFEPSVLTDIRTPQDWWHMLCWQLGLTPRARQS